MHGREDEVIPFAHGAALLQAAPEPKRALWVPGDLTTSPASRKRY